MSLGERIKEQRKSCGLSQEKVAELVGVSRQAVTKWETDQSSPSTANLFRLAEIFGTTVDLLLNADEKATASPAEQIYYMYKLEQEQKRAEFKSKLKKNVIFALYIAAGYFLFFLIGRFIWCDRNYSFLAWLFSAPPSGEHSYLYGWLLSSNMFAISAVISVIPAFFGKRIYPIATLCGFFVGFLAGFFFGPNPDGAALGMGHYGWAIWGVIFFASVVFGIIIEIIKKKKQEAERDSSHSPKTNDVQNA